MFKNKLLQTLENAKEKKENAWLIPRMQLAIFMMQDNWQKAEQSKHYIIPDDKKILSNELAFIITNEVHDMKRNPNQYLAGIDPTSSGNLKKSLRDTIIDELDDRSMYPYRNFESISRKVRIDNDLIKEDHMPPDIWEEAGTGSRKWKIFTAVDLARKLLNAGGTLDEIDRKTIIDLALHEAGKRSLPFEVQDHELHRANLENAPDQKAALTGHYRN